MNKCRCGKSIGLLDKYCQDCEKRLSIREKVIEGIRKDKLLGSYFS